MSSLGEFVLARHKDVCEICYIEPRTVQSVQSEEGS